MNVSPARAGRRIVHVDMDAFYASVEQRDDETLRNRPVVVAWRGARSVVCAASYEARKFGVRSAMPAVTAERLCPEAVFVPPDFARYKAVSRHVRSIFARNTDLIEPLSLDEAYLDLSSVTTTFDDAVAVASEIRRTIFDELFLTASAGIAVNKFLAKISSDWNKPNGQFAVRPGEEMAFLSALPVGRIPGVGKVMEEKLVSVGLRTCRDIRAFGIELMQVQFGDYGLRLWDLAHGLDDRPVAADHSSISISAEDTFENDITLDATEPFIRRLSERVWRQYERACLQSVPARHARTVVLKLKTADFRTLTRSVTPLEMPSDGNTLAEMALDLRDKVELPGELYRLVGVGLAGIEESVVEQRPLKY